MKTNIKTSIIIPVSNLEIYIEQCLKSVVSQTLKDIEIICIDDASIDNSLKIIQKFASEDKRIKIIELKEKMGQAFARNRGIELAQSEYIGFVDGDDWIEPDMFEKLYNKAKSTDSDITICGAKVYDEKIKQIDENEMYYSLNNFDLNFDNKIFSHYDTKSLLLNSNVAIWNKVYKKSFLDKIGGKFAEGYIYEDLPFFYKTYLAAEKITIIRDFLYYYRINRSDSTMNNLGRKVLDRVCMVSQTLNLLQQLPYYQEIKPEVIGWVINDLYHRYTLVDYKYQKEFYYLMQKLFKNLDIYDLNLKFLISLYSYPEFILVKSKSYEECNSILFTRYKNAKIEIKELKHDRNLVYERMYNELDKQKSYYEHLLKDAKIVTSLSEKTNFIKNMCKKMFLKE